MFIYSIKIHTAKDKKKDKKEKENLLSKNYANLMDNLN